MLVLIPILANLIAVITGFHAVGDGRTWNFTCKDILRGDLLAKVYVWIVLSTAFSLVHMVGLLTASTSIVGTESFQPAWLFLHTLIGVLFATAHLFVDAVFRDRILANRFFGYAL